MRAAHDTAATRRRCRSQTSQGSPHPNHHPQQQQQAAWEHAAQQHLQQQQGGEEFWQQPLFSGFPGGGEEEEDADLLALLGGDHAGPGQLGVGPDGGLLLGREGMEDGMDVDLEELLGEAELELGGLGSAAGGAAGGALSLPPPLPLPAAWSVVQYAPHQCDVAGGAKCLILGGPALVEGGARRGAGLGAAVPAVWVPAGRV